MTAIVIVPGLGGSGPEHWQTHWEARYPSCVRVEQADWDKPQRTAWCAALEAVVAAARGEVVLVAHSLGCQTVAHWAAAGSVRAVKAALLVAPPDVETSACIAEPLRGFAPVPRAALPFPTILVASRDDPYARIDYARALAASWGARFEDAGELGHVNADSRLGDWPAGRALLDALR